MQLRKCKKCGVSKPLSGFYGFHTCKECVKAYVRQHRQENLEYYREYDRHRGQLEHRKAANRAHYKKIATTKKGRKRLQSYSKAWTERNRQKRNVHIVVGNAVKRGLIIPDLHCHRCGAEGTEAHHEDYSKPFDITWLCKKCHGERHREMNEKER